MLLHICLNTLVHICSYVATVPHGPCIPVGTQAHRYPKAHGACLGSDGSAYVSRAQGRVWRADATSGRVLNTLKFSEDESLQAPARLYATGSSDHVVAFTGAHLAVLSVGRVVPLGCPAVCGVLAVSCVGLTCYLLCRRLSSGEVVPSQLPCLTPSLPPSLPPSLRTTRTRALFQFQRQRPSSVPPSLLCCNPSLLCFLPHTLLSILCAPSPPSLPHGVVKHSPKEAHLELLFRYRTGAH